MISYKEFVSSIIDTINDIANEDPTIKKVINDVKLLDIWAKDGKDSIAYKDYERYLSYSINKPEGMDIIDDPHAYIDKVVSRIIKTALLLSLETLAYPDEFSDDDFLKNVVAAHVNGHRDVRLYSEVKEAIDKLDTVLDMLSIE